MRHSRAYLGMALAVIGLPGAVAAQPTWGLFCGGGVSFHTCGAVDVGVTDLGGGRQSVAMKIWNASGQTATSQTSEANAVWTAVGFFQGAGKKSTQSVFSVDNSTVTMSGPVRGSDTPANWQVSSPQKVGGGVWLALAGHTGNGVDNGIASGCANNTDLPNGSNELWLNPCYAGAFTSGGWINLAFEIQGAFNPSEYELLVKAQNVGPNGEFSIQCITGEGEKANCTPMQVVPEPATVALLGTGLLGVALAARRRRSAVFTEDAREA